MKHFNIATIVLVLMHRVVLDSLSGVYHVFLLTCASVLFLFCSFEESPAKTGAGSLN